MMAWRITSGTELAATSVNSFWLKFSQEPGTSWKVAWASLWVLLKILASLL